MRPWATAAAPGKRSWPSRSASAERSGNPKLKVQFNSIFGYYIEVSKAQADGVPADYERKQTLVNAERFTTPELKTIEQRVLTAEDRRKARELTLFEALRLEVAALAVPLLALAARLAELDALAALADAAAREGWVRPLVDESQVLDIKEGRHPVVESLLKRDGASLHPQRLPARYRPSWQLMLITGPNMAGKSTYMRQQALLVVLAQIGSFVPKRPSAGACGPGRPGLHPAGWAPATGRAAGPSPPSWWR